MDNKTNDEWNGDRNDIEEYGKENDETNENCPENCGGRMIKEPVADGPDDYKFTWTCEKCGETYSN